jgi:SAM-dependent methyltransferase
MRIKTLLNQLLSSAGVPGWKGRTTDTFQPPERFPTTEEFLGRHAGASLDRPNSRSLDLGCGQNPRNPFRATYSQGIDIASSSDNRIIGCDLAIAPIPCDAALFDFLTAFDFIEHIPRVAIIDGSTKFPFILLMNEIYRVLKPGGLFFAQTPAYPCKEAFQDPTHVNIITEDTFPYYFCEECWAKIYGFTGSFTLVAQEWCRPSLLTLIQKR